MAQITINGQLQLLDGALRPNTTIVLRRDPLAVVPGGSLARIPEPKRVTSDGSANVSFVIESGTYVGTVSTEWGEVSFAFEVDETPSAQSFGDCVAAIPSTSHAAVAAALLAAGLPFYATRPAAHTDAALASGATFLTPDPNGVKGLMVYEKVPVGGGVFTSAPVGAVFPSAFIPPGTVGAPGLPVDGDADTGLFSPAANQLAGVAGGVLGWLLSSTGLQVPLPITGAAVTQTRVDTTAGRLLKVGDFGLGGGVSGAFPPETTLANIDSTSIAAGFYQTINTTTGTFPAGESLFGQMIVFRYDSSNFAQIWMSALSDTLYTRRYRSSDVPAFSPWRPLFSRHNILGTVSQAAGVPTGAVIQRGSNANGEFVRYADGTQICTRTNLSAPNASTALGAVFRSADVAWTYPIAFAAAPTVQGDVDDADCWLTTSGAPGTASANLRALAAVTKAGALNLRATAIGRWF